MKKTALFLLIAIICVSCAPQPSERTESSPAPVRVAQKAAVQQAGAFLKKGAKDLSNGNLASAINNLNKAIRSNPRDSRGYLILGQTYLRLKQYDRAIEVFKAETAFDPDNGQIHYLLAMAYGLNGENDMAIDHAQRSIEIFQDDQDQESFLRSLSLLQGLNGAKR